MPQPGKCVNDNLLRRNIAVKAYGKGYLWTTLRKPWFVCELGHDEVGLKKDLPKLWSSFGKYLSKYFNKSLVE